jgi:hypothetical protein
MDHILVIDLGTYCDQKIMESAKFYYNKSNKNKVVYLTDKKHNLPEEYIKVGFKTPEFYINDPKIKIADTNHNFAWWLINHPQKAIEAYKWSKSIKRKIIRIKSKYDIKSIHILYPAIGLLWLIEKTSIPIFIYYYAPGLLCKNIPWIFDSILKTKSYKLYDKSNYEYNKESGLTYLNRISMNSGRSETIHEMLKSVTHLLCWDKNILPKIVPVYKDLTIKYVGSLLDINNANILDNDILKFVNSKDKIIFMSFGSYGNSDLLQLVIPKLLEKLNEYCDKNNGGIVYHNGNLQNTKNIYNVNGFIQYESIVSKSDLIIFTGSYCLQNICYYYCKPLLFVPLLSEQFFWAKNYSLKTNKPYIDYQTETLPNNFNVDNMMQITKYEQKISKSIKKT